MGEVMVVKVKDNIKLTDLEELGFRERTLSTEKCKKCAILCAEKCKKCENCIIAMI